MRTLLDLQIARDLNHDSGLSETDYDVLSTLSESPEQMLRLGDLAAHMLWSKSRLSHHITRMQQRGLVARQDCAADGRGAMLTLTEAGWQAIRSAAPAHVPRCGGTSSGCCPPSRSGCSGISPKPSWNT
jgi:DNA-binding MarR family transcriptional regulator